VEPAAAKVTDSMLNLATLRSQTIAAPLSGQVILSKVQDGAYVTGPPEQPPTLRVAKLDPMRVNFISPKNESLRGRMNSPGKLIRAAARSMPSRCCLADGSVFPAAGRVHLWQTPRAPGNPGLFLLRARNCPTPRVSLNPVSSCGSRSTAYQHTATFHRHPAASSAAESARVEYVLVRRRRKARLACSRDRR